MSTYKGWAIKLKNGKFMNDSEGDLTCALFFTRRDARAHPAVANFAKGEAKIVRVTVTVKESK